MSQTTEKKRKFPVLETERFILRKIIPSDAPELFHYFSKDEVTKYYDLDTLTSMNQAAELIIGLQESFEKNEGIRWGVALKETDKIIGSAGYHSWEKSHFKAELGFEVTPEYWRKGVMTEILPAVISYAFHQMGLNRIEARYHPGNIASKGTLRKQGFTIEGVSRESSFEKGRFCDAVVCSLLKKDLYK
ncbi:GNAT family N-acetyltransferase [Peribacillus deserti]|uniref:GNAT family N-acetyltransferase n=1 Tax=Peribacillus deserti TaxID=673318 RepID=A0A2N5M279_9BACI|nr:GNAT family protein [Peribacillus deserti]PLT28476.1 GNAT family N-acetyltransferase [Peribacillus deserti]